MNTADSRFWFRFRFRFSRAPRSFRAVAGAWVLAGVIGVIGAGGRAWAADTGGSPAVSVTVAAAASSSADAAPAGPRVREAKGRVLVRAAGGEGYRGRAAPGLTLAAGEVVMTGPRARVELEFAGEGRWRIGQEAVWRSANARGDAALNAGSALVAVPDGGEVRVEGVGATLRLGEGVWLLTAVLSDGFKIVALDRGVVRLEAAPAATAPDGVEPGPADGASSPAAPVLDERRLRAGEVVFASPDGKGFGPVVTVFLDELLATSRLVGGFEAALPQAERLRQQGAAQREALTRVGNVFVGGARQADGFQLIMPKAPAPASEAAPAAK
jgi:hypothetical protein